MAKGIEYQTDLRPRSGSVCHAESLAVLLSTASGAEPAPPDAGTSSPLPRPGAPRNHNLHAA